MSANAARDDALFATCERAYAEFTSRCAPRASSSRASALAVSAETRREAMRWASDECAFAREGERASEETRACALARVAVMHGWSADAHDFAFACSRGRGARHASAAAARAYWTRAADAGGGDGALARLGAFVARCGREVTLDVWRQAREFARACEALGTDGRRYGWYDDAAAWPTLLDEFVESERAEGGWSDDVDMSARGDRARWTASGDGMALDAPGTEFAPTLGETTARSDVRDTRKRRDAWLDPSSTEVMGLTREFERELAVNFRPPKRVCSDMDLDDER